MKKIGIIAAMEEEMQQIKEIMEGISEKKIYNLTFYIGTISQKECILVECGIGKVNAARTTQILIDNFDIEYIVNVGTAGATSTELNTTDVVIADKLIQHDFDITAFGHPKGYISNVGLYLESDTQLMKKMEKAIKNLENIDFKILVGTIASGDIFCTDIKMKEKIRNKFEANAIEMEGAAIAQVCKLDDIPFIVIRGISDSPNGNNEITFEQYLEKASKRCAQIIEKFFEN